MPHFENLRTASEIANNFIITNHIDDIFLISKIETQSSAPTKKLFPYVNPSLYVYIRIEYNTFYSDKLEIDNSLEKIYVIVSLKERCVKSFIAFVPYEIHYTIEDFLNRIKNVRKIANPDY